MVAVLLVALMSVVAIAIDGGLLLDDKRQVQAAADAAALAGATDMYINFPTYHGVGQASTTTTTMTELAFLGFDSTNSTITVTTSDKSAVAGGGTKAFKGGPKKDNLLPPGYVEVVMTYNQPRGFSGIFASGTLPVTARAVARGSWAPFNNGIICLNPTSSASLFGHGNGIMTVAGTNIVVNSNSPQAAFAQTGTITAAQQIYVTGSYQGGFFTPAPTPLQPPVPDPLASIPTPAMPTTNGIASVVDNGAGNFTITLTPGFYPANFTIPALGISGLNFSGKQSVVMQPGMYYFAGPFSMTGQGNLTANGVFIYDAYNDQVNTTIKALNIAGQGAINMSPMTTGTYQGILYMQDRTSANPIYVGGNGNATITGTFYAASAHATVLGNGTSNTLGSQYVVNTLEVGGNGNMTITASPPPVPPGRTVQLVE
jgi:hypothetical protein